MDWCIESTSVVIVGVGFLHAATDGNLSLMTRFFDRFDPQPLWPLNSFSRLTRSLLDVATMEPLARYLAVEPPAADPGRASHHVRKARILIGRLAVVRHGELAYRPFAVRAFDSANLARFRCGVW